MCEIHGPGAEINQMWINREREVEADLLYVPCLAVIASRFT